MDVEVKSRHFQFLSSTLLGHMVSSHTSERRFRSAFGVSPTVCAILWQRISLPAGCKEKHLLWGLFFLKVYDTEHVSRSFPQVDEKTYRKWVWIIIEKISELNIVGVNICIHG